MAKAQWETEAIERFLAILETERGANYRVVDEDVVVNSATNTNYDFELARTDGSGAPIALEMFRLIEDSNDLATRSAFEDVSARIMDELTGRGIAGWLIRSPYFRVSRVRRAQFAREQADLISAGIKANADKEELTIGSYECSRIDGLTGAILSPYPQVRSLDPSARAKDILAEKLEDKNAQLNTADHERAILVISWGFPIGHVNVVEACSQLAFAQWPNIDRVYYESSPGHCRIVFDRETRARYDEYLAPAACADLYAAWLQADLEQGKPTAFALAKQLIQSKGTDWLSPLSRAAIVKHGDRLADEQKWSDVQWIVETFRNDPDPSLEPTRVHGEKRPSLHERVREGDDIGIITSTRGHVAWLLQKIVCAPQLPLFELAASVVQAYATGPDLYVRMQSTVPLAALVRRRYTTTNGAPFMGDELRALVRETAIRMAHDNATNQRVLDAVARVIVLMHDLTQSEFRDLVVLLVESDSAPAAECGIELAIYYALFRDQDSAQFGIFDRTWALEYLRGIATNGHPAVRNRLSWLIGRLLYDKLLTNSAVEDYVEALLSGAYDHEVFGSLFRIFAKALPSNPVMASGLARALQAEGDWCMSEETRLVWHSTYISAAMASLTSIADQTMVDRCNLLLERYRSRVVGLSHF